VDPGGRDNSPRSAPPRYGHYTQTPSGETGARGDRPNPYTRYQNRSQDSGAGQPSNQPGNRGSRNQSYGQQDQGQAPATERRTYRVQPRVRESGPSDNSGATERRSPYTWTQPSARQRQSDDQGAVRDRDRRSEPPAQREPQSDRSVRVPRGGGVMPERPNRAGQGAVGRVAGPAAGPSDRRGSVPTARFRGPEADRQVRVIDARQREQTRASLNTRMREWNRTGPVLQQGRLVRDLVGNPVPRDARVIQRNRITRISPTYTRVTSVFGMPRNYYSFMPRYPGDYQQGYWDGYRDGWWDGRAHVPHRHPVVVSFYYGFYWSDPAWFGFYYPGYYPAVYHYWGWCPGWVYPNRVYVNPVDYVYVPPITPYRYYAPGYSTDERGVDRAIGDIRQAWMGGDMGLISNHLTDQLDIQVYFDGEYNYTTSTDDYYAMTADAVASTQTVSMDFDDPIWLSTAEVFYTGRHVFYDPDGNEQTVYVSYRLRRLGSGWYIVSVGSSLNPIQHHYRDFRDN